MTSPDLFLHRVRVFTTTAEVFGQFPCSICWFTTKKHVAASFTVVQNTGTTDRRKLGLIFGLNSNSVISSCHAVKLMMFSFSQIDLLTLNQLSYLLLCSFTFCTTAEQTMSRSTAEENNYVMKVRAKS